MRTTDLTPLENVRAEVLEVSHRIPGRGCGGLNDRDPEVHDVYRLDFGLRPPRVGAKEHRTFRRVGYRPRLPHPLRLQDDRRRRQSADATRRQRRLEDLPDHFQDQTLTTSPLAFDESGKTLYLLDSRGRNTAALAAMDSARAKRRSWPRARCATWAAS